MAWFYLLVAGILEVVWAYAMKKSAGFTILTPSIVTIVAMIASSAKLPIIATIVTMLGVRMVKPADFFIA